MGIEGGCHKMYLGAGAGRKFLETYAMLPKTYDQPPLQDTFCGIVAVYGKVLGLQFSLLAEL